MVKCWVVDFEVTVDFQTWPGKAVSRSARVLMDATGVKLATSRLYNTLRGTNLNALVLNVLKTWPGKALSRSAGGSLGQTRYKSIIHSGTRYRFKTLWY